LFVVLACCAAVLAVAVAAAAAAAAGDPWPLESAGGFEVLTAVVTVLVMPNMHCMLRLHACGCFNAVSALG
jgi:Spy/CpxP family protein refolding chaperone